MAATAAGPPELPALEPGVTLLETPDGSGIDALQALAIDRVLLDGGVGYWIDTGRHAVTSRLRDLAPDDRVLDRLRVARGFTAYQHAALVRRLLTDPPADPAVLVVPAVDAHYRGEDLRGYEPRAMLGHTLAGIAAIARRQDVPVVLTRSGTDALGEAVAALAERTIAYRETAFGPRFDGEGVATYGYDLDGPWLQTTWAFWRAVLDAREPLYERAADAGVA